MTPQQTSKDIDQLKSFLRGERSAVETYDQVIEKADGPTVRTQLQEGRNSHAERVALLEQQIRILGGKPDTTSGPWGAFAKAVEGGAKAFGLSAAVAVLEEGEDHGLKDYKQDAEDLSPEMRTFVNVQLLPRQQRTHDTLSRLKDRL